MSGAPPKVDDATLKAEQQKGAFVRQATAFHDEVKKDGSTPYTPEAGRYHLYISDACPWAHRCYTMIVLLGLEDVISVSSVDPLNTTGTGWQFSTEFPDPINSYNGIREVYFATDKDYGGRFTVPVLYDKKTKNIVNNESSEIIRMLNSEFAHLSSKKDTHDFYPSELRAEIEKVNGFVYPSINNGVYRSGFAKTQEAYDAAVTELFQGLDSAEALLQKHKYLTGDVLTEADIRLWTTLVRFDAVYFGHFKCNLKRIQDYPGLTRLLEEIYNMDGIAATVKMDSIKYHYYASHTSVNPTQIVPKGPSLPWLRE